MKELHATQCDAYDIINATNSFEFGRRNSDLVNLCLAAIKDHNSKEDAEPLSYRTALEWFSDLAQTWCDEHDKDYDSSGRSYIHSEEGTRTIEYCALNYSDFTPRACDAYMLDLYYNVK